MTTQQNDTKFAVAKKSTANSAKYKQRSACWSKGGYFFALSLCKQIVFVIFLQKFCSNRISRYYTCQKYISRYCRGIKQLFCSWWNILAKPVEKMQFGQQFAQNKKWQKGGDNCGCPNNKTVCDWLHIFGGICNKKNYTQNYRQR